MAVSASEPAADAEAMGVRAYFGVLPAELVSQDLLTHDQGRQAWGRSGPLSRAHHLLIGLFDVPTGNRISDAAVDLVYLLPGGGIRTQRLDTLAVGRLAAS